jgi:hypothetical protein
MEYFVHSAEKIELYDEMKKIENISETAQEFIF